MAHRRLATLAVVLVVVLAGCAGGGGGSGAETAQPTQTAADQAPSDGGDADSETGLDIDSSQADTGPERYRIKRATYRVTVADFDAARSDLRAATRSAGGYVGSESFESHERDNVTWRTGTVVLRVPADDYASLVGAIEAVGNVEEKSSETVDVTGKVVDLQARLANLRAQRERLRTMFDQADSTEDMLQIQERLSEVQSDIERLEGRLRTLENKIAYSKVTVHLSERHPEPGSLAQDRSWYDQSLVAAFVDSIDGAVVVARMIAVAVASAIPYLALFGGLGGVGLLLVRVTGSSGRRTLGQRITGRFRSETETDEVNEEAEIGEDRDPGG